MEMYAIDKDKEEMMFSLFAFDKSYMYSALGLLVSTEKLLDVMKLTEIIDHRETEYLSITDDLQFIGKKALDEIKELISIELAMGDSRLAIKKNYHHVQQASKSIGYQNPSIALLITSMLVRGL
ncbi:hypothetical protein [Exiguobacterium undae]|uniref:hypothetical protein n=1 Tax=Exiguobacterium undae TaxID=169177 RepID=UPI00047CC4EE|nr:hypothetical protein [Exiguobacterium undae]